MWTFCRKVAHTPTALWISDVVIPCLGSALPSLLFCVLVKITVGVETWGEIFLVSFISLLMHIILIGFYGLRLQDRLDIGRVAEKLSGPMKSILLYFSVK